MTVGIISWSIFMKVWDRAGIKLVAPGPADAHLWSDTIPTELRGPVRYHVHSKTFHYSLGVKY